VKRIVYTGPDGNVFICTPASGFQNPGESDDDFVQRVARKDVPPGVPYEIVEDSALPTSRIFRNQWRFKNGKVAVDMPLARIEKMARIRAARDKRLEETDREFIVAQKRKDNAKMAAAEAKSQILRDIPQTVDLNVIQTPEELEAFEPDWPE
jgi:hypothetical protein